MKILIVEDNEEILAFVKKGLQYENYLVDGTNNGEDGLNKASSCVYDIIVLDLLLPKLDGKEFVEKFRASGSTTPIIILSAITDSETKTKLLDLGADDYLVKPFSFTELVSRMKAVLRRSSSVPKKEVIQIEDLLIDPTSREVTRNGIKIDLRRKEFELLSFMARHPGEVLNQATLLEKVWDFNGDASTNTLGSHISSLRNKIDGGKKQKLIHTIHGVGYKLAAF
jgi:DNA-binding response OmpR family regulator